MKASSFLSLKIIQEAETVIFFFAWNVPNSFALFIKHVITTLAMTPDFSLLHFE